MLPRKSAVVKKLVVGGIVVFSLVMWFITPGSQQDSIIENLNQDFNKDKFHARHAMRLQGANKIFSNETIINDTARQRLHEQSMAKGNLSLLKVNETVFRDFMKDLNSSTGKQFVNPHPFRYTIQPRQSLCGPNTFLIVFVHTAPHHFKRRAVIRQTWGNARNFDEIEMRVIFVMGLANSSRIQDGILFESNQYGDTVQENFVDSYRNLTYKAIGGMRWISFYCKQAKYVLKTDDDIFVNIFSLMAHLQSYASHKDSITKTMFCLVWRRMKVMRNPRNKWFISKDEFEQDYFPQYCSGSAFIYTNDLTYKMFNASLHTPFFWVDDFYVTGLLAKKAGANLRQLLSSYILHEDRFIKGLDEPKGITYLFTHIHNLNKVQLIWKKVLIMVGKS